MTPLISFGDYGESRMAAWHQHNRWLTVAFALSVAAHIAVFVLVPQFRRANERMIPRTLDVVIVRPAAPAPIVEERVVQPKPKPKREPREHRQIVRTPPRAVPQPVEPPPRPVLALPQTTAPNPPAFTVPQVAVESPPPVEPKPAVGAAPPAPPAREAGPTVQASFNAAYLHNAPPKYPLIARRNGVEGTVRLKVFVTRDGRAGQVQLDQTSGSSALDSAAFEAVRTWQFVPARRGPESIDSWVVVPVVFKLEGTS